jgi:hypothetical protein
MSTPRAPKAVTAAVFVLLDVATGVALILLAMLTGGRGLVSIVGGFGAAALVVLIAADYYGRAAGWLADWLCRSFRR